MINSDNFQALNLIVEKFNQSISTQYIDPPYNTSASEILYKNNYQHSSWMTLLYDRLNLSKKLLAKDAIACCTIDDAEMKRLSMLLDGVFGSENECAAVPIRINPSGRPSETGFAFTHEYALFYRKSKSGVIGRVPRTPEQLARFNQTDEQGLFEFRNLRREGANSDRADGQRQYYPIFADLSEGSIRLPDMFWDEASREWKVKEEPLEHETVIYPINNGGIEKNWRWSVDNVKNDYTQFLAKIPAGGPPQVYYKYRPKTEGTTPLTLWVDKKYSATEYGTRTIKNLFKMSSFSYPKSIHAVEDCIRVAGCSDNSSSIVLDYFSGSGTTGHAVINLNREDKGNRKYILCEMGSYFDSVTKPRIQKAIYANKWKDGKPIFDKEGKAGGISQCFKYIRLEQYEDTLNNLIDDRSYNPDSVPKDFMLSYMLEAETAESPSLLNLEQFSQPRNYKLQIKHPNSDQSKPQVIDLVETFNWLIGLNVVRLDKWRAYDCDFERESDPELPQDQHTRLKVTRIEETDAYADDAPSYQLRRVEGWVRRQPGNDELRDNVLVIWRNLSDDPEKDSAVLEAFIDELELDKADSKYDKIYINGSHGLQLHGSAKTRLVSLEETFMAKMWEDA